MSELTFDDQNFDSEVLKANVAVLVDFWAPWCGPCKMQGPIIDEVTKIYEGKKIKIGKLNVDQSPQVANRFHIMSIPTLMIFKDGKPVEQMTGVQDKNILSQKLDKYLG